MASRNGRPGLPSLRIEDLSDREFLLIVVDHAQEDGWANSEDVSAALGFESRRYAAMRFSWLARYGAVEREHARDEGGNIRYHRDGKVMHTQRWRLTELGEGVAHGKLRKAAQTQLEKMDEHSMIDVTAWLTDRARGSGYAKMVERQWRYGTSKQRW